jgi:glycosyltransferase involved in cell wall biosynthesis
VTYFGFHAEQDNPAHAELKTIFERVVCCPLKLPRAKSFAELLQYASGIFSSEPYGIRKYCRPWVARELRLLAGAEKYDVTVCDFLAAAGVVPWDLACPKVLFTHNVEALIWKRHYEVARNPLWKLLSWREWQTMQGAERKYLQKADHVLAVSQADRECFSSFLPSDKVTVIPTGVDLEYFHPQSVKEEPDSLVFTGSMDWLPNEDGVFYFVNEMLPLIRREIPGVKLYVVGRKPSPRLQAFSLRNKSVQLSGWVEDIRPYLAKSAVCIVPLRVGSGTRLKIFEAMAMGKAVVSTTIGAEGLPVRHGENILSADTPEDFARRTIELLRDPALRNRIGSAAHQLVKENFAWARVAEKFSEVLERVSGLERLHSRKAGLSEELT